MLYYTIQYYYGKNKKDNILKHIQIYNEITTINKMFIIFVSIDSRDINYHNMVKDNIYEFVHTVYEKCKLNLLILSGYNYGGTIQGLYECYLYIKNKENFNKNDLIAHFEEDFFPINNIWLKTSIELLNTDKYIYIGEHTPSSTNPESNINNTKQISLCNFVNSELVQNYCKTKIACWTDGGYYCSFISNFIKIEEKIGKFHKGDENTQYDHYIDGILLGEVGFPTQVKDHFEFTSLLRSEYFIHS